MTPIFSYLDSDAHAIAQTVISANDALQPADELDTLIHQVCHNLSRAARQMREGLRPMSGAWLR